MLKGKEYIINPEPGTGKYRMFNEIEGKQYFVDVLSRTCSCDSYKYRKKNRFGNKTCKHLRICRGIK